MLTIYAVDHKYLLTKKIYDESMSILGTYIYQLRRKLIEAAADSDMINWQRGIGYKFIIP